MQPAPYEVQFKVKATFGELLRGEVVICGLPGAYSGKTQKKQYVSKPLSLLAHATPVERVTFAFGGQRYADSWRKVEEARSRWFVFRRKPLKGLALPRGIEPLFQP